MTQVTRLLDCLGAALSACAASCCAAAAVGGSERTPFTEIEPSVRVQVEGCARASHAPAVRPAWAAQGLQPRAAALVQKDQAAVSVCGQHMPPSANLTTAQLTQLRTRIANDAANN